MYELGVVDWRVPPVNWDSERGESWTVSDEALRIWAQRVGLGPELVVEHERERFAGGRRESAPPHVVYADAEAVARGTYKTPREFREEQKRRERGS
jgi:hypothetical protein